ncbi:MAG: HU family DNA-binding protein [Prevotellaceae bacterium]|jgi:predicted histone-like DNA-binding protein|nr:HU family DNA-binding protein [Prevotellaceae bacterium]
MKFKKVQRPNPQNLAAPKKWFASPVNAGTLTLKEFAEKIAGRSSLTKGDILNVLSNFLDEIPLYLEIGMSVQLGDFGTLRLSLASEGVENPDDFTVANITGVKIIFTPSSDLKKALSNIKFEEAK